MRLDVWNMLFNILLLVFWFKIWNRNDRDSFFNPFLSPLNKFANASISFLKPVFFGFSNTLICIAAFIFVIVFRAVIFSGISLQTETSRWVLYLSNLRLTDMTIVEAHAAIPDNLVSYVMFSLISFLLFMFNICSISLIYLSHGKGIGSGHTGTAIYHVSYPLTLVRNELRPVLLLAAGIVIQLTINLTGSCHSLYNWPSAYNFEYFIRLIILSISAFSDVLLIIQQLVIFLIIGSWIAIFTSSFNMMRLCREWLDFFLGPMRRYPVVIGMLDLSPIIFIFLLGGLHALIKTILLQSYLGIAGG